MWYLTKSEIILGNSKVPKTFEGRCLCVPTNIPSSTNTTKTFPIIHSTSGFWTISEQVRQAWRNPVIPSPPTSHLSCLEHLRWGSHAWETAYLNIPGNSSSQRPADYTAFRHRVQVGISTTFTEGTWHALICRVLDSLNHQHLSDIYLYTALTLNTATRCFTTLPYLLLNWPVWCCNQFNGYL